MKYFLLSLCISVLTICKSAGQTIYEIDVNIPEPKFYSNHLKLGGNNSKGDKISVNNYFLSFNDKPFIPITGEFHFSRYANQYWDESIKKIKAGGINTIATYVFWNIHEEKENVFNWKADNDLRRFVELCAKNNLYVIVRVGPFCHGEIRNGGLPDWIMGKALEIRSNDPEYLFYVERLFKNIGEQLKGLYFKDGGPIIGIQLENEYQHSAAPWGLTYPGQPLDFTAAERDLTVTQEGVGWTYYYNPYSELGNNHMSILKALAVRAGMDVPIYTATGWGNAAIIPNECIPVTAAYAYPFWTPKRDLSPFFLYKDMHKYPDYSPVRYKAEDYPAFPAELGSGISSVYTRRSIAVHKSFDAMINRCLGSGANGIGYYMYHGGSTPRGIDNYFSDEAYGLTKIAYDYQSPIGEYGQVREGFHRLKLMHFFVRDFGELLAPMVTVLPKDADKITPENITDLRYAVRVNKNSGFVFLNNFQDDTITTDKTDIQLKIKTGNGEIKIPENGGFDLISGENAILPFNFNLGGANLKYATAQLMMKSDDPSQPYFVFFTPEGMKAEFSFSKSGVKIQNSLNTKIEENQSGWLVKCSGESAEFVVRAGGVKTRVLVINRSLALRSYVVNLKNKKYVFFSGAVVLQDNDSFTLLSDDKNNYQLSVYPQINTTPKISVGLITKIADNKIMTNFSISQPEFRLPVKTEMVGQKKLVVDLPVSIPEGLNDIYLVIDYTGDTGMGFLNGELFADDFYKGIPWQIGLRKFLATQSTRQFVFYFRPMYKNATYLVDLQPYPSSIPDFGRQETFLKINKSGFMPEYKTIIQF